MSLQSLPHGTVVHAHPPPPPPYDHYHICSPNHPFLPGAPITKRMFKDLHHAVFGEALIRGFHLEPTILNAEACRHFASVALRNNCDILQPESSAIYGLQYEMGTRGPIRLLSLWKKYCCTFLVQSNLLDPAAYNFSAFIADRVVLARQDDNKYEWLHLHDSQTGEKQLFRNTLPLGLMAEFLSDYCSDAIRHEIVSFHSPRALTCGVGLKNLRYSLACAIITLQYAFSADWNWDMIQRFDSCYSSELANEEETTEFFEEVNSITGQLIANWDHITPQLRDAITLAIRKIDHRLLQLHDCEM